MIKKFNEFIKEDRNNSNDRLFIARLVLGDQYDYMPTFYRGFFIIEGEKVKAEEVSKNRLLSMAENGNCLYVPVMISDDEIKTNDKYLEIDSKYHRGKYDHIWLADHEDARHSANENPKSFKMTSNEESDNIRDAYLSGDIESSNDVNFENYTKDLDMG
ncbi:MAG: hypothetical protein SLAVMIC_00559 [uncultured marine phage]|uniref:Uncharacterized protein n=1 Tax=uncultured marine phage TaxID=707152 RepID=A0A8D9C945_9VIRU|nr:MAG: hypothetical protein SLAVMIC_00559 [uncultured marine phage]